MIVTNTNGIGLNVRKDPDANSPKVGSLDDGAAVDAADHAWRHVRTGVLEGWAAAEFLEDAPPAPPLPPSPNRFTAEQVANVLGAPLANVEAHLPRIYAALDEQGIGDRPTIIAALATIGVETGSFLPIREAWWLSEEWRRANFRYYPYYGRGFIQITWESNYRHYGDLLGVDLVDNPDRAMEPEIAARILALYFVAHNIPTLARQPDWYAVRLAVNGGDTGWDHFARLVDAFVDLA